MINILLSITETILLFYILHKFYKTRFRLYIKLIVTNILFLTLLLPYILEYKVYNYIPSEIEKVLSNALDSNMTDDEIIQIVKNDNNYSALKIVKKDKEIKLELYDVKMDRLIIVRRDK